MRKSRAKFLKCTLVMPSLHIQQSQCSCKLTAIWIPSNKQSYGQSSLRDGDEDYFFPGCYIVQSGRSLLIIGQTYNRLCALLIRVNGYRPRGPKFDSWHYQIFWEVLGLEWGSLNLVSTTEELLRRNTSGSSLEIWEYGCEDPLRWPHNTLCLQKLALALRTNGGHSV
jgi:hypothetical protein